MHALALNLNTFSLTLVLLLGHPDFKTRQAATKALTEMKKNGQVTTQVLDYARRHRDPEVKARAKLLSEVWEIYRSHTDSTGKVYMWNSDKWEFSGYAYAYPYEEDGQ